KTSRHPGNRLRCRCGRARGGGQREGSKGLDCFDKTAHHGPARKRSGQCQRAVDAVCVADTRARGKAAVGRSETRIGHCSADLDCATTAETCNAESPAAAVL